MGKRGPCFHCGTETENGEAGTPLWRNGPPEKPVLCNACGSRYRLTGSLLNYTPKHLQTLPKKKKKKQQQQRETILNSFSNEENFGNISDQDNVSCNVQVYTASQGYESNNKSTSSEFTTASSTETESCLQEDGSQRLISDKIQQRLWDVNVPSKKRSLVVYNNLSTIEKLQRDLYKIQNNRNQNPANFLPQDEEDGVLLYNNNLNNQNSPFEIGLGTILLKQPRNQEHVG